MKKSELEAMKMKDIVPYTPNEKRVIEKTVGVDTTDNIPPVHDAYASFVVEEAMKVRIGGDEIEGKYTGWWLGGKADGRGTWRSNDGKERYDTIWKNGVRHGTGRTVFSERDRDYPRQLTEGEFENGDCGDGRRRYFLSTGNKLRSTFSKKHKEWIELK